MSHLFHRVATLVMGAALVMASVANVFADGLSVDGDILNPGSNADRTRTEVATARYTLSASGPDGCNASAASPTTVTLSKPGSEAWLGLGANASVTGCTAATAGDTTYTIDVSAPLGSSATVRGTPSGGIAGNNGYSGPNSGASDFTVRVIARPPTGFMSTGETTTSIDLAWTASPDASDIDNYGLEKSTDSGSTWDPLAMPLKTATSYPDSGLDPDTEYCYRIQSRYVSGGNFSSIWVGPVCVTTDSDGGGPVTPELTTEVRDADTDTAGTSFPDGTAVYDHASVDSDAEGTVDFYLYSGSDCTNLAGEFIGSDTGNDLVGSVADSGDTDALDPGSYYFIVDYNSSDTDRWSDTSTCEEFTIEADTGTTLSALSDFHGWIGLKNSDDQGTKFDLQVELLQDGDVVSSGLTRCIPGVTRNPSKAYNAMVSWDPYELAVSLESGDVLSLRVSTRIGTNANGTFCGGHSNAVGLRLYYDSATRQSRFEATIGGSNANWYLRSDGNACVNAESTGVTHRDLSMDDPTALSAKCKDSTSINFAGGNLFKVIGTWYMAALP